MNEQLQQALTAILNKTMSGVDAGVSFLSAEIPDVIHQLLIYRLVISVVYVLVGLFLLVAAYKMTLVGKKNHKEESAKSIFAESEARFVFPFIVAVLLWVFGFSLVALNAEEAVKIWLAPKIFLIEYAAHLAK